jgi:hypothetical protein
VPQRDQVSSAFVSRRCQDVEDEALDHGAGGFVPERIVALMDDDERIGNPPRLVDCLFVFRVERLTHAFGVLRPPSPSGGSDRCILAFGIDDAEGTGPEDQIIND